MSGRVLTCRTLAVVRLMAHGKQFKCARLTLPRVLISNRSTDGYKQIARNLSDLFRRHDNSPEEKDRVKDAVHKHPDVLAALEEIRRDFGHNSDEIGQDISEPHYEQQEHPVSRHLGEKFVLYEDADAEVILDTHEELEQYDDREHDSDLSDDSDNYQDDLHRSWQRQPREQKSIDEDLNLNRGVHGVYDIEDLVAVLRSENAGDVCVVKIPEELCYADYLVVASGRSRRHLKAIVEYVTKMYKRKKDKRDAFLRIQGENSKDWMALDMGNIVLHVMLSDTRTKYDIESLWSVGEKYDRESQQPQEPIIDALQKHLTSLRDMKPLPT